MALETGLLETWDSVKKSNNVKCNWTLLKRSSRYTYLLRYGLPRISREDRLKRSGLSTLKSRRYNPIVQNYQWERSNTVGQVFCTRTKQGNSWTHIYIIGLFTKLTGTLGQKFFSARCHVHGVHFWNGLDVSVDIITAFNGIVRLGCSIQGSSWLFIGF